MPTYIATQIIEARQVSVKDGQDKYRAYFISTPLYARYKANTDTILKLENCADCIVTA